MEKTIVLGLFLLTYILLLALPKYRPYIALTTAAIFAILSLTFNQLAQLLPLNQIFGAVDWNVLMMIAGTMVVVYLFIQSRMPDRMADIIIDKMPNVKWAVIALAIFSGVISAFIDNVATVLILAPIAINVARKLKISPVIIILAISMFSNLEGAATLVGDTTSILLGGYANMNFLDFFIFNGRLGPFFIIQFGLLAAAGVLYLFLRKQNKPISIDNIVKVDDLVPSYLLLGIIGALILASFIPTEIKPAITNGLVTISFAVIGITYNYFKTKDINNAKSILKNLDYDTLLLLAGLFIIIQGISNVGLISDIANVIVNIGGTNPFVIYTIVVFFSVLVSAFIDNIPYVATMLPVMTLLAANTNAPIDLLYLGLLFGATLGGNITPIGASANVTGIGILRKEGFEVKLLDYVKLSIPITLAAVLTGYIITWFIYS
jgi:Na+/H+ antiporter NhaD/arsenite permease-like protein